MSSLPLPPQLGQPAQGPMGPITQAPTNFMPGTPPGAAIANGIVQFITNYRAAKEAAKTKAGQEAESYIKLMLQGIPLDQTKVAKTFQKAGIPLPLEGPSAAEINFAKQKEMADSMVPFLSSQGVQQAVGTPQAAQPTQVPGLLGLSQQQLQQLQAMQAAQQATEGKAPGQGLIRPKQPGVFSNFMRRPEPAQNSPGMEWLRTIAAMGQQQMATAQKQQKVELTKADVLIQALNGNPKATELAVRFLGAATLPIDELEQLADRAGVPVTRVASLKLDAMSGGPQMRIAQLNNYYDALKNDSDRYVRALNLAMDIHGRYQGLPLEVAQQWAVGAVMGDAQMVDAARKTASQYIQRDIVEQRRWQAEQGVRERGATVREKQLDLAERSESRQAAQGWARIDLDKLQATNAVMARLFENNKEQMDKWFQIYMAKDLPDEKLRNEAVKGIINASAKLGEVKFTLPDGSQQTVANPKLTAEDISFWGGWFGKELMPKFEESTYPTSKGGKERRPLFPLIPPNPQQRWNPYVQTPGATPPGAFTTPAPGQPASPSMRPEDYAAAIQQLLMQYGAPSVPLIGSPSFWNMSMGGQVPPNVNPMVR